MVECWRVVRCNLMGATFTALSDGAKNRGMHGFIRSQLTIDFKIADLPHKLYLPKANHPASLFTQLGNTLLADSCELACVVRKHPLFVKLIDNNETLTSAEKATLRAFRNEQFKKGPMQNELTQRAQKRKEMG